MSQAQDDGSLNNTVAQEEQGEVNQDDLSALSVEELKAKAEALENENKSLRGDAKDEEIRQNMLRRIEKAQEKNIQLKSGNNARATTDDGFTASDIFTLAKADIDPESEKAKVLLRYISAGFAKSAKEALDHPGVKAELAAIGAAETARSVITTNDTQDTQFDRKATIIARYKSTGEVDVNDKEAIKIIAEDNLKQMHS